MELVAQMTTAAGVAALPAAVLWWLRRRGNFGANWAARPRGRSSERLERLDKLTLSPQHTLHLVRWGDLALLVAASPGGCSLIRSRPCGEAARNAAGGPEAAR